MMEDLIPGLPDEIARECLIRVPYDRFPAARSVSKLWRHELDSRLFHRLRRSSGLTRTVVVLAQADAGFSDGGPAHKYAASTPSYRLTRFEPITGTWASLPPIPCCPHGLPLFCQLAGAGRQLVVVGGWDPDTWAASDQVFVYDFAAGTWRRGAPMPGPRRSFFACAAAAGAVLLAGGHDEEKNALRSAMAYDIAADGWASLPDMARERDECRGVALGGRFHVLGGYATEMQGRFGRSAESFDLATRKWGPVEEDKLEAGTCPRTCTAGGGGRLYMCRRAGELAVLEEGGGWRAVAELPEDARVAAQAVAWEDKVLVVGSGSHGGPLAAYVLDGAESEETSWRRAAVPLEFSGHVQAVCCLEI